MITIPKKPLYVGVTILLLFFLTFLFITLTKPTKSKSTFLNTIPFIGSQNGSNQPTKEIVYQQTNTPPQTNLSRVETQIENQVSQIEKDKISGALPVRIENFKTSTPLSTTINLYSLPSDPVSSLRLEIYGLNYNNTSVTSDDAIAFKDSFLQIKKTLVSRKMNLKNTQLIYGNRQYIQDSATNWVNYFKLLD